MKTKRISIFGGPGSPELSKTLTDSVKEQGFDAIVLSPAEIDVERAKIGLEPLQGKYVIKAPELSAPYFFEPVTRAQRRAQQRKSKKS